MMPNGQDLIVAIITLGALMMLVRNIMKGRRSACGRGACGCGSANKPLENRMGSRRELVQLQIGSPAPAGTESQAHTKS